MRTTLFLTAVSIAVLGGCSTDFLRAQDRSIQDKERVAKDAQESNLQIVERAKVQKSPVAVVSDKAYLGVKPVPIAANAKPPAFLSRRVELLQEVNSLSELIEPLSSIARVPVIVREDALQAASRLGSAGGAPAAPTASGAASGGAPVAAASQAGPSAAASSGAVPFRYSGALSGLLDLVAARYGISWRYLPSGAIEFFHRDTRTFAVMVLPGDLKVDSDIGTSGGSSGSVGGASTRTATQRTTASVAMTFWKELEASINAVRSRDGIVTVNTSVGTVTVTDTPTVLEQVGKLIDGQNALLTKQVLMDVKVVNLTLKRNEAMGIDWNAVYKSVGGNTFSIGNTSADLTGATQFKFDITDSGRKLYQTNALLKALAEQGDIGAVTSAQQFALNNQATPIQVGRNARFVESSTTTPSTTAGVPNTTTYTTNTITSGVALQLLPRILDNQNLLMHFSVDISDEPEDLALAANVGVSLYKQNVRNFLQRVSLRSGETLVLSGYERTTNKTAKSGAVTPDNPLLGGGRSADVSREVIVIMITPVIMDRVRS